MSQMRKFFSWENGSHDKIFRAGRFSPVEFWVKLIPYQWYFPIWPTISSEPFPILPILQVGISHLTLIPFHLSPFFSCFSSKFHFLRNLKAQKSLKKCHNSSAFSKNSKNPDFGRSGNIFADKKITGLCGFEDDVWKAQVYQHFTQELIQGKSSNQNSRMNLARSYPVPRIPYNWKNFMNIVRQ